MSPRISIINTRQLYLLWLVFFILTKASAVAGESAWNAAPIIPDLKPQDVVKWQANTAQIDQQGTVTIDLRLRTEQNFTLYVDQVQFSSSRALFQGKQGPPVKKILDPIMKKEVEVYGSGEFTLTFTATEAIPGSSIFPLKIRYIACTKRICLFPHTEILKVPVYLEPSEPRQESLTLSEPASTQRETSTPTAAASLGLEDQLADQLRNGELGLWVLLLIFFLGGLLTNLTPCVYPMIPITIRLLAKQTNAPWRAGILYALGITTTYSALGIIAAVTGSLFGEVMASPLLNAVLAGIMLLLGLSMLGYGEITALQSLGQRLGDRGPGGVGAFLMGAGAGLVASPCTGPILAALLTYIATQDSLTFSTLSLTVYSLGFALPYVFLGSLSSRLSTLRVSGQVQLLSKSLFGAVMFG